MKAFRKLCLTLLALAAFAALGYFTAVLLVQTPQFREWLLAQIQEKTGYQIQVEKIEVEMPFSVTASAVEAGLGQRGRFTAERVGLNLDPLALFSGKLRSIRLVRPVLRTRLDPATESQGGPGLAVTVGSLQIEDGKLLLENAKGDLFPLPAINLQASNLDLGKQTGALSTTADVPWLGSVLEVSAEASPSGITATVSLHQQGSSPPSGAESASSGFARAEVELAFQQDGAATVSTQGELERFKLGSAEASGDLALELSAGKALDTVQLSLKSRLTRLSVLVEGVERGALPGPMTILAGGRYSTSSRTLSLSSLQVKSPYASMAGRTELRFEDNPRIVETALEVSDLSLEKLDGLLAQVGIPLTGLDKLEGKATARISVSGRLAPAQLSGLLQSEIVNASALGVRFSKLNAAVPFTYGSGMEVRDARFTGRDALWKDSSSGTEVGLAGIELRAHLAQMASSGNFSFVNGRFNAKGGLRAGEHISGKGRFSVRKEARNQVQAEIGVEFSSLEMLWDRFFGDFKDQNPSIQLAGRYDRTQGSLELERSELSIGGVGKLELKGRLRGLNHGTPELDITMDSRNVQVLGLYDRFIKETFNTSYPLLGKLQTRGTAALAVELQGTSDAFRAQGSLELRRLEIEEAGRWRVGPVRLTLPFRVQYPKAVPRSGPRNSPQALVSVAEIEAGRTKIQRVNAFFTLWDNRLQLLQPVRIALYGGALIINELAWEDIIRSARDFSFAAAVSDLELSSLSEDMGWYRFEGTLSGVVPRVTWVGDTLRTNGELNLTVFGGRINITDLQITQPTAALPSLQVNVRLEDLDLERATKAFEFGRISGILEGAVDRLVITHGQPAAFEARVQTVSKSGVGQWISVEALNKISVLSSGTESGLLYGTLAKLFDFYRYRKLGFTAKLENDLMILRGIVTRDGKEYLVEGTLLPPTVNIVSHTQEIGFSELVRRLERVQQAGKPTTQGSGP